MENILDTIKLFLFIFCSISLLYIVGLVMLVHWEKKRGLYHPGRYRMYSFIEHVNKRILLKPQTMIVIIIAIVVLVYPYVKSRYDLATGTQNFSGQNQASKVQSGNSYTLDRPMVESKRPPDHEKIASSDDSAEFGRAIEMRRKEQSRADFCEGIAREMRHILKESALSGAGQGEDMKALSHLWVKTCE